MLCCRHPSLVQQKFVELSVLCGRGTCDGQTRERSEGMRCCNAENDTGIWCGFFSETNAAHGRRRAYLKREASAQDRLVD